MTPNKLTLSLSCLALMGLSACSSSPKMEEAKYWQRSNASSSLYLQGPKAQQTLHKHISQCVSEIKELDNLGEIRRAVPASYNSGNEVEPAKQKLKRWETPLRDGFLYNEHMDYHDLENCMRAKGWERVEHLPYSKAHQARQEYLKQYAPKKQGNSGARENVTTLER